MLKKAVYFVMVLSVFWTVSCAGKQKTGAVSMEQLYSEQGQPVSVRELVFEDFSVYLKYPTVVYASSESTAYAALSDVVRVISAKVGDTVRQDEVIVSFSADNQSLRQAALAYENAAASFNRSGVLFRNNDISRQDFDAVRMQYEMAGANLKAANNMVYVKAPISGTITQLNVHVTENVRPGTPLFTVSNQNGFEARFYVGAAEIERIQTGARVFIDDPSNNIEGRVTQVSLVMDSQKQSFPATAFFGGEHYKLVSGMGVDIAVETYRNDKAIVVSRRELLRTDTGYTAFIAVEDGSTRADGSPRNELAKPVAVKVGHEQGLHYEITHGLEEGDMLITSGAQRLSPNMPLNIVSAGSADTLGAKGTGTVISQAR
jgi:RND family efflux transporter MFP subunit